MASGLLGAEGAAVVIEAALGDLETASSLDAVLTAEAVAASSYWPAWCDVPVRFVPRDLGRIPSHWTRVGQRRSPLSESARSAVTPAHAILNYWYALLTAESRIACLTMGLDPGLGILHADKAGRDSLVADVMEVVRPDVDTFVLELLERRTFSVGDFVETRSGSCRVLAPLIHELAESAGAWSRTLGAVTEGVASDLARLSRGRVRRVSTPLTQKSRAAAVRRSREPGSVVAKASRPKPSGNCRSCGGPVPGGSTSTARPAGQLEGPRCSGSSSSPARRRPSGVEKPERIRPGRRRRSRRCGGRQSGATGRRGSGLRPAVWPRIPRSSGGRSSRASRRSRLCGWRGRLGCRVPTPVTYGTGDSWRIRGIGKRSGRQPDPPRHLLHCENDAAPI